MLFKGFSILNLKIENILNNITFRAKNRKSFKQHCLQSLK